MWLVFNLNIVYCLAARTGNGHNLLSRFPNAACPMLPVACWSMVEPYLPAERWKPFAFIFCETGLQYKLKSKSGRQNPQIRFQIIISGEPQPPSFVTPIPAAIPRKITV